MHSSQMAYHLHQPTHSKWAITLLCLVYCVFGKTHRQASLLREEMSYSLYWGRRGCRKYYSSTLWELTAVRVGKALRAREEKKESLVTGTTCTRMTQRLYFIYMVVAKCKESPTCLVKCRIPDDQSRRQVSQVLSRWLSITWHNLRSPLFWCFTQRRVVIPFRRFGTNYRSHIQG